MGIIERLLTRTDYADREEAAGEIERLRAGGCARGQKTTQWCAEASDARARIAALEGALTLIVREAGRAASAVNRANMMERIARAAIKGDVK